MDTRQISALVLRQRLSELIEEVGDAGNAIIIAPGKKPAAVLIGYEQYRSLLREAGRPDILPADGADASSGPHNSGG